MKVKYLTDAKFKQVAKRVITIAILLVATLMTTTCRAPEVTTVATVEHIYIDGGLSTKYGICVEMKPTEFASAGKTYIVELWEKGQFRDAALVSWDELELNVLKPKTVAFNATKAEHRAYYHQDIDHIFKVNIQSTPVTLPSASLITFHHDPPTRTIYGRISGTFSGTVTNNSEWSIANVWIEIKLLDNNNKVLRCLQVPVSPNVIPPGGKGTYARVQKLPATCNTCTHYEHYPRWDWILPSKAIHIDGSF